MLNPLFFPFENWILMCVLGTRNLFLHRSLSVYTNEEDKTFEAFFDAYLMIAAEVRDIFGA